MAQIFNSNTEMKLFTRKLEAGRLFYGITIFLTLCLVVGCRPSEGHTGEILSVAFLPDGTQVASSGDEGTIRLWDIRKDRELRWFKGHTKSVLSIKVSPDGHYLLSGSGDGTVRLWDVNGGGELRRFQANQPVLCVAFSRDGRRVACGGQNRVVIVWESETGRELNRCIGHKDVIGAIAFTPDGQRLLSGS